MTKFTKPAGATVAALALVLTACNQDPSQAAATTDAGAASSGDKAAMAAASSEQDGRFELSYLTGYQIGQNLKGAGLDVDVDALAQAISDAMAGKESMLTPEQIQAATEAQQAARMAAIQKQNEQRAAAAESNKTAGAAFLAENGQREGVTTTESGLQYEVLTMGDGAQPTTADTVRVHYAGTLIDETPFDSSYQRGEPAEFPVTGVIKGWTEGLQLMPVGSKFKFVIPSELAYGPQARGNVITANSTLVFEVELLDIVTPES